jgi:hypothetical protein
MHLPHNRLKIQSGQIVLQDPEATHLKHSPSRAPASQECSLEVAHFAMGAP